MQIQPLLSLLLQQFYSWAVFPVNLLFYLKPILHMRILFFLFSILLSRWKKSIFIICHFSKITLSFLPVCRFEMICSQTAWVEPGLTVYYQSTLKSLTSWFLCNNSKYITEFLRG